MALWSCVSQLNAGRPEEEVSLLSVHLAYHHFRSRLLNFSRILTIHPPILLSLTKGTQNHSWALREMVWPLLRTFHAFNPAWPPQASGGSECSHHHAGKGKLIGLVPNGRHLYQHTHQCGSSFRTHLTHASWIPRPWNGKLQAWNTGTTGVV